MGDLVAGQPALRIETTVSLPLDMVSVLSLLYRADLDLLHGFTGRLLYYPEEPVMRFEPLRPDRLDATFDELRAFMGGIPAAEYCDMVEHALERVHADLEMRWRPPNDEE